MARCPGQAVGRARRALDALRTRDGGRVHAEPGEDRARLARPRGFLMANTTRVVMPQLGESVHEGTISKWLVKPGDKVVGFERMLEVDTDKVSAEVPAPVTGVLKEIIAKEGETVQAGAEIAVVELDGEGKSTSPPAERSAAAEPRPGGDEQKPEAQAEGPKPEPTPAPKPAPTPPSPEGRETESAEQRFSPAVTPPPAGSGADTALVQATGLGG